MSVTSIRFLNAFVGNLPKLPTENRSITDRMRWRRDEQKGRIAAPISKGRLIFEKTENGASIQLPLADHPGFPSIARI